MAAVARRFAAAAAANANATVTVRDKDTRPRPAVLAPLSSPRCRIAQGAEHNRSARSAPLRSVRAPPAAVCARTRAAPCVITARYRPLSLRRYRTPTFAFSFLRAPLAPSRLPNRAVIGPSNAVLRAPDIAVIGPVHRLLSHPPPSFLVHRLLFSFFSSPSFLVLGDADAAHGDGAAPRHGYGDPRRAGAQGGDRTAQDQGAPHQKV